MLGNLEVTGLRCRSGSSFTLSYVVFKGALGKAKRLPEEKVFLVRDAKEHI